MEKIDHKKTLKEFYNPPRKPVIVDVPELQYLMIDGRGYPGTSQEYADAMEALFATSYTLKFAIKKADILDYTVMPIEGLWWAEDMEIFRMDTRKDEWLWTSLIMQPPEVTKERYLEAVNIVKEKKNPVALPKMRLESYYEGFSVQIMHIGPFSEEGPTIEKVHQFIDSRGKRIGKHHEIYLSDIRKADPAKWKTVIRQPMQ